ncbi:MAG TPA: amidohydrolase [Acidobacteria bacterium]|nr:amidohydrolase [Acidobacteriota bacterium]MDP6372799.1 amidohydrolase family protein [Vicinamibacterales bacterium]HAK54562.1 amidohydrolase [Acidobacteriota bacterium]
MRRRRVGPAWSRREWLAGTAAALAAGCAPAGEAPAPLNDADADGAGETAVALPDFEPRSMLHVAETRVVQPRFPVIDVHTHLTWSDVPLGPDPFGERIRKLGEPSAVLPVMDRKGVRTMVNLTGGVGPGLTGARREFDEAHPGRFITFTEPSWNRAADPDYPRFQAEQLERDHAAGARGLKLTKTLGLYLREQITSGPLVTVDDSRFDPMWETCAALGMPVAIHVSDPEAFFLPIDRFNERYEELHAHPDWSFHGSDFPSNAELLAARDRVLARHPGTTFIGLHVGHWAENLAAVGEALDRFPNFHVEIGARIGELGRQPRAARRFFERYQDRILFGTDAIPSPEGDATPQQVFGDALYEIYYRFLETEDEYFDYAPAPVPPQGRWRISGLALPDEILRKVYHENAERVLGLTA